MPLTDEQAASIISLMRSSSVEQKLDGIEQAQKMFDQMFYPGMELIDYAKSAKIVEDFYNIIRNELKQGFRLLVNKEAVEGTEPIPKKKKEKAVMGGPILQLPKPNRPKVITPKPETVTDESQIEFLVKMLGMSREEATAKIKKG